MCWTAFVVPVIVVVLADPGKIMADLAVMVALGVDCLADAAALRAEPAWSWSSCTWCRR